MKVAELMSSPVIVAQRHTTISYLKDLFVRKHINAVPVVEDDGTITGIVSSSDVLKCSDDNYVVEDIMTDRVHIALKNNRVKDAAGMMTKNNVHHLVVMENGGVVGMLSSMDIVRIFSEVE